MGNKSGRQEGPPKQIKGTDPDVSLQQPLVVMTLNMGYFSYWPTDKPAMGLQRLKEALHSEDSPDVLCVQEGLCGKDVFDRAGYELVICTGERGLAQPVSETVYGDEEVLQRTENARDKLVCNQIYRRVSSEWLLDDAGCEKISSDLQLDGSFGRKKGKLVIRTMVWAKLKPPGPPGKSAGKRHVYVMCTHISGGRYEDQYFAQMPYAAEKIKQIENCTAFYKVRRPQSNANDVGILAGDFNATTKYQQTDASYFQNEIISLDGPKQDAGGEVQDKVLEENFANYMTSPFKKLSFLDWKLAYNESIGVSTSFGQLIDHIATSGDLRREKAEVVHLTNQVPMNGRTSTKDTDIMITDHNAVKVKFIV